MINATHSKFKKWLLPLMLLILGIPEIGISQVDETDDTNPQTICLGSTEFYQVDATENGGQGTPGSTYQWTVSTPTATITPNQGTAGSSNRIQVDWSATIPGPYTLTVQETNNGCLGPVITLNVVISPALVATIAPVSTPICSGSAAVFNITGPANGTVVINIAGTDITVNLNASGTGTHTVNNATADVTATLVSVSNGTCSNTVSGLATVVTNPEVTTSPIFHD